MKRMPAVLLVCFVLACACFFAACDGTASIVSDRVRVSSGLNAQTISSDPNAATPDDYFRFNLLGDGTYEILARYHDMPNRLVIPSEYNGKSVTGIGDVFGGNTENDCLNRSVEEIVLPNSITKIGDFAFYYYVSLRSVMLPSSVQTVGRMAFAGCGELESITIPDGVRSLDESFYRCTKLVSVTIPSSMESFVYWTFGFCESLSSITFKGTKAQWDAIEKAEDWDRNSGEYVVHCTDGDIAKE